MTRRMLGAPFGGTTRGGHHGFESFACSLMTPPNLRGAGGSCLPSRVIVASGEPGVPVICCAATGATASVAASKNVATVATTRALPDSRFMLLSPMLVRTVSRLMRHAAAAPWNPRQAAIAQHVHFAIPATP